MLSGYNLGPSIVYNFLTPLFCLKQQTMSIPFRIAFNIYQLPVPIAGHHPLQTDSDCYHSIHHPISIGQFTDNADNRFGIKMRALESIVNLGKVLEASTAGGFVVPSAPCPITQHYALGWILLNGSPNGCLKGPPAMPCCGCIAAAFACHCCAWPSTPNSGLSRLSPSLGLPGTVVPSPHWLIPIKRCSLTQGEVVGPPDEPLF
jgi:hypothetical protein